MAGHSEGTGGIFQKVVTVTMLFGMAVALRALLKPPEGAINPASMATLGFIILAAYVTADLAERIRLPHITGYLLTGLACGPYFLGLLNHGVIQDLQLFNALAVALIALAAGGALRLEMLRRGARVVGAVLFSQFGVLIPVFTGLVILLSGAIPGFSLPFLRGLPVTTVAAVALVLAVVASAQSPAASIAIIESTGAKGPVSDAVLGVSILNNVVVVVLFALAMAAAGALDPSLIHHAAAGAGAEPSLALSLLIEVGGAGVLGVALGFGIAAYIRFVNQEFLLVLGAMSFLVTWAAGQLGVNEVLAFLAAGFVVRNYTGAAEELSAAVSTLSLPVYVLFFFIAGAGIHVDALEKMWPFALLLFAARLVSLLVGTSLGTRVSRGPQQLARYGWMGFGAQAGIALSMAIEVGHSVAGIGLELETLAVAGIALNEMFGPVLLQFSLGLVGELPSGAPAPDEALEPGDDGEGAPAEGSLLPAWIPEVEHEHFDPWGPPPKVDSQRLTRSIRALKADLQVLVIDLRGGPVAARRVSGHAFLALLRRDFLRFHRGAAVLAQRHDMDRDERVATLRRDQGQLARRWENQILDRAASADFSGDAEAVERLVSAVDRVVAQLDSAQTIEVVLEPERLVRAPSDGPLLRLGRARLRIAARLRRKPLTRLVDLHRLARFYLSGHIPGDLYPVVGLMALSERHLVYRGRALFEVCQRSLDQLLSDPSFAASEGVAQAARLNALRDEVEAELALAHREVDRLADETVRAASAALGREYRALNRALMLAGTPELPPRRTRYSRIYDRRQEALSLAMSRLTGARLLVKGVAGGLAMELELARLRGVLRLALDSRVDALERELRGRVVLQLGRVTRSLDESLESLRAHLEQDTEPQALGQAVREATSSLARITEEALGSAESLRNSLKTEATLEPLRADLQAGIEELTDRFTVSTNAPERLSGRGLPPLAETREIDFRAAVQRTLETAVNRDLSEVSLTLLTPVDATVHALENLSRSLAFNAELSLTELELSDSDALSEATRRGIRDTLLAAILRAGEQLRGHQQEAETCAETVDARLSAALMENLDELIGLLIGGHWTELRLRAAQGQIQRRRALIFGGLSSLPELRDQAVSLALRTLGEDNAHRLRTSLGLPDPMDTVALGPRVFSPPPHRVEFPVAFRRLFADTGLDAGALLTGREHEVERVRRTLLGEEPGTSRAVAVVGVGGIGQGAVVNALVRGLSERLSVTRYALTQPVTTLEEVDAMLHHEHEGVVIVDGLHWLFGIRPGGFAPLRHFLKGVLRDRGRNAWLISAQRPVWAYANRVVPLADVFPEQVHLHTLDLDELRQAVLTRHRLSGFHVRFTRGEGHPLRWLQELVSSDSRGDEGLEASYFQRLHEATGGGLADALQLWMASIKELDPSTQTMVVGELPRTSLHYVRRLPEATLMTLRQVARQGRLTVQDHATQFRADITESKAVLSRMAHWGLLSYDPQGFYTFSPWLLGTLYRVLRERRLVG